MKKIFIGIILLSTVGCTTSIGLGTGINFGNIGLSTSVSKEVKPTEKEENINKTNVKVIAPETIVDKNRK